MNFHGFTLDLLVYHSHSFYFPFPTLNKGVNKAFGAALEELPESSQSRRKFGNLTEKQVKVYNLQDWKEMGPRWIQKLQDHAAQEPHPDDQCSEDTLHFPPGCRFTFLLHKTGQDVDLDVWDKNVPYVNMSYIQNVVMHVAHDFSVENHILFFNTKKVYDNLTKKGKLFVVVNTKVENTVVT
jgi:hypothetical protein